MNIILKAFDGKYSLPLLENALRDLHIDTCVSILNDKKDMPSLDTKEHIWVSAMPLMAGEYPDVNWNEITPLDEELIENMRDCEAVFLTMVERYTKHGDISYKERKRAYLEHLRYWNHIIEIKNIDLLLMNTVSHQCYDHVIYCLCKLKGIPTLHIERFSIIDAFSLEEDWKESGKEIGEKLMQLEKQYADSNEEIPLSKTFEDYFKFFAKKDVDQWYLGPREKHLMKQSFVLKWSGPAMKMFYKKPHQFFTAVISPTFWLRKWRQHVTAKVYDKYTKAPDLSQPFIYVPLHYQPEATTCPMAGVFTDQDLMVDLIAQHLPPGIAIYVKEHPAQGETCRSEAFYRSLNQIASVTLIPRNYDTFQLADNCLAIATATGTAGFEALFRGKSVLMFGHRFFQYAKGIYRIHSRQDLDMALKDILSKKNQPTIREARLFLKAIDECTTMYAGGPDESKTKEEKTDIMADVLQKRLSKLLL